MQHVGDTVIYSEDPSGTSLIYLEDDSGRRVTTNHDTLEPIVIYDSTWDQELTSKELRRRHPKTRQEAEYPIVEYDSRLDPEWKETRNDKETPRYLLKENNPNFCTLEEWRNMEDKLPHTPENATEICAISKEIDACTDYQVKPL